MTKIKKLKKKKNLLKEDKLFFRGQSTNGIDFQMTL